MFLTVYETYKDLKSVTSKKIIWRKQCFYLIKNLNYITIFLNLLSIRCVCIFSWYL